MNKIDILKAVWGMGLIIFRVVRVQRKTNVKQKIAQQIHSVPAMRKNNGGGGFSITQSAEIGIALSLKINLKNKFLFNK